MGDLQALCYVLWWIGIWISTIVYIVFLASPWHTKRQKVGGGSILVVLATITVFAIHYVPNAELIDNSNDQIKALQSMLYLFWFLVVMVGTLSFLNIALDFNQSAVDKLGLVATIIGMEVLCFFLVYDLPNMPIMKGLA